MRHDFRGARGRWARRPEPPFPPVPPFYPHLDWLRPALRQALLDQAVRNVADHLPNPLVGLIDWSTAEWMPRGWLAAIRIEYVRLARQGLQP